ncbi:hypothetical protein F4811DRAFT_518545 [Daldinia bambusicola]|nr:hypothetical protein F4811DRAFT_518545 [Daldinia bambusicola]
MPTHYQRSNATCEAVVRICPDSKIMFRLYRPHISIQKALKIPSPVTIRLLQSETKSMDQFFAQHSDFRHDETAPVWDEFGRLCEHYGWKDEDFEKRVAKRQFKDALIAEFERIYGSDSTSLSSWQKLCRILEIHPIPDKVKNCRKKVLAVHVNLVDLVDCQRAGKRVRIFANLEELQGYTRETEKYFPKNEAKSRGPLRHLLRNILG